MIYKWLLKAGCQGQIFKAKLDLGYPESAEVAI